MHVPMFVCAQMGQRKDVDVSRRPAGRPWLGRVGEGQRATPLCNGPRKLNISP